MGRHLRSKAWEYRGELYLAAFAVGALVIGMLFI